MEDLNIGGATVLLGDCIARLKDVPDQSVQTCVTSPPYFGLRDYGHDGQLGLEPTPEQYIDNMVEVFREVRRVLADDGTLWLNIGDSYAGAGPSGASYQSETTKRRAELNEDGAFRISKTLAARGLSYAEKKPIPPPGLKKKDLIGIPWMLAFALRADGWYLRQDIIWHKPNPMPESVRDRCTKAHEYVFLLSKSERYFYDHEAIKEPETMKPQRRLTPRKANPDAKVHGMPIYRQAEGSTGGGMRNRRSVWTVATRPYKGAHFATFPPALIEPCILAGTSERGHCPKCGARWVREVERRDAERTGAAIGGDPDRQDGGARERAPRGSGGGNVLATKRIGTNNWRPTCACGCDPVPDIVLDPFNGSGTTGHVALQHGRRYLGTELNPDYVDLTRTRLEPVVEALAAAAAPDPQTELFAA